MAHPNSQAILDWIQRVPRDRDIPFPGETKRDPDVPVFWTLLHHDVRVLIYEELLEAAGTRHHVTAAGQNRARPLMRTRCDDKAFIRTATCGHRQCTRGKTESLQDLISLMMTCKIGHLDVSEFLYRKINLVFEDFVVLQKFIQTTCPRYVSLIRRLGFIINAGDTDVYHDLNHAYECQPNTLDLFRYFTNLQCLEVNVYLAPSESVPLWPIRDFKKIALAFSKTSIPDVLFRVPYDPDGNSDETDEDDDYDSDDHHNGDEDGNDVWVHNVVGAATATNEVVKCEGLEWHRVRQFVPDLPSNALQQYTYITLLRPVHSDVATCKIFDEANSHDIRTWEKIEHNGEHRWRLTPRLRKLLQSLHVSEEGAAHGGSTE
ncbi:hypothetical protein DL546_008689 [Coniochaeta pulveracea]|uniref:DUF7730 domain-containing protein n=1 Tax=Coniochaeta pulveracea TaxID=177199 RepID=A0A420YMT6_9PEZI|nr:hypothetical protein DL546_008689 [Coniochaeta pulveracea]